MNLNICRWEGAGHQIVCFHGFGGSGMDFQPLAEASSHHWMTIDLLGHGESPKPEVASDYSLFSQLKLVDDLIPPGAVLLGYSMGARLVLWAALDRHDLGGLVLIGGRPGLMTSQAKADRKIWDMRQGDAILEHGSAIFMKRWAALPIIRSQIDHIPVDQYIEMQRRRSESCPRALAASLRGFGSGTMPSAWPRLSELHLPTLLVTGEKDEKYTVIARKMNERLPAATHVVIDGVGHCAHLENQGAFLEAVDDWLGLIEA